MNSSHRISPRFRLPGRLGSASVVVVDDLDRVGMARVPLEADPLHAPSSRWGLLTTIPVGPRRLRAEPGSPGEDSSARHPLVCAAASATLMLSGSRRPVHPPCCGPILVAVQCELSPGRAAAVP